MPIVELSAVVTSVTEAQRRDMIVRCADDCELALIKADNAGRTGTVRERFAAMAQHQAEASLLAQAAMTWACMEVVA